jgi:type VI secretion system protein ImpK
VNERVTGGDELARQFRAFHAELLACVRRLAESPEPPEQVRAYLAGLIDAKAQRLDGPHARDNGSEVRYLMAAFADEMLITRPWAHQDVWIDHLLEAKLFGTRNAGDRIFSRIAALREDTGRAALAEPYLYALALGFRGRHGGDEANLRELARMRSDLFKLARERSPDAAFSGEADASEDMAGVRLMERAYRNTVGHGVPVMLPNPYRWRGYFFLAFGTLLLIAFWIWHARTSELRKVLHHATQAQNQTQAAGKVTMQAPPAPPSGGGGGAP